MRRTLLTTPSAPSDEDGSKQSRYARSLTAADAVVTYLSSALAVTI